MTPDFVMHLGWAIGKMLSDSGFAGDKVIIGKDTRISGYMLENAIAAGLSAAGMDAHLLGVTLEQFFEPVRQMINLVGIGMLVFYGLTVVEGVVVMIIEVAAVMSIGAQGRWNRLGFGAPAVGLVIVYVVNQITALVATLLLPLSLDMPSGRVVGRMMLPQFIEAVRADQEPHLVGIGSVVVAPILAAILVWWAVRAIERHTCLR